MGETSYKEREKQAEKQARESGRGEGQFARSDRAAADAARRQRGGEGSSADSPGTKASEHGERRSEGSDERANWSSIERVLGRSLSAQQRLDLYEGWRVEGISDNPVVQRSAGDPKFFFASDKQLVDAVRDRLTHYRPPGAAKEVDPAWSAAQRRLMEDQHPKIGPATDHATPFRPPWVKDASDFKADLHAIGEAGLAGLAAMGGHALGGGEEGGLGEAARGAEWADGLGIALGASAGGGPAVERTESRPERGAERRPAREAPRPSERQAAAAARESSPSGRRSAVGDRIRQVAEQIAAEPATPATTERASVRQRSEPISKGEEIQAELEEFQERAEASGGLQADMLSGLSERPEFRRPSSGSEVITPESPVAKADATFQALMEHVFSAQERFNIEGFTEAQTRAIERAPTRAAKDVARARFHGERIDSFVKESIQGDRRLDHLGVSEIKQPGPDFFDPTIDTWYDITSAKSWARQGHQVKYRSSGTGVYVPSGR